MPTTAPNPAPERPPAAAALRGGGSAEPGVGVTGDVGGRGIEAGAVGSLGASKVGSGGCNSHMPQS